MLKRKRVDLNGQNTFYLDSETSGSLLLCLHGRFGRAETWHDLMGRYSGRYRVVAPDQRGHGFSDQPRSKYTSEVMALDAARLIDHLSAGPAIVVGHSMGGRIAGYIAALHPGKVAKLVVLDQTARGPEIPSTLSLDELPPKDSFTADWPLPFPTSEDARAYLKNLTGSEIRVQYYLESLIERTDGFDVLFSQWATSAIHEYQEDWFHLLAKIHQPTLLVRAKDSIELPEDDVERMQSLIGDCRTVEVSRPDHHVYLSDREEFYSTLDGFLEES